MRMRRKKTTDTTMPLMIPADLLCDPDGEFAATVLAVRGQFPHTT